MPSDLQITNIKDQANANSAITIGSDGQVTISQNNPTVTLGTNATFPSGHIIKTESTLYTGTTSDAVGSANSPVKIAEIATDITVSGTNDVLILISAFGEMSGTSAELYTYHVIYRTPSGGSDVVLQAPSASNRTRTITSDASSNYDSNPYITPNTVNILYVDDKANLSAGTYTYALGVITSDGTGTYYTNRSVNDTDTTIHPRGVSQIVCMEIQA
jgi:hypothetical protein